MLINTKSPSLAAAANVINTLDDKNTSQSDVKKIFSDNGASVEDIAKTVGRTMRTAYKDSDVLKACELAAKMQQIYNEDPNTKVNSQIIINIVAADPSRSAMDLLFPSNSITAVAEG